MEVISVFILVPTPELTQLTFKYNLLCFETKKNGESWFESIAGVPGDFVMAILGKTEVIQLEFEGDSRRQGNFI